MSCSNEGVVAPFLARLLEVFVSYMDEDNFWSTIEDGPSRIGPIGVKKVSIHFAMWFMLMCRGSVFFPRKRRIF